MSGTRRFIPAREVSLLPARRDRKALAHGLTTSGTSARGRSSCAPRASASSLGTRALLCLVVLSLVTLVFGLAPVSALADSNTTKAEMLWNIAKFVQWPDTAPLARAAKGQIVFTILGEDDLAAELAGLLSSKTINGRPVFVRFARRPQDAKGSQILYIAGSEMAHVDDVLAAIGVTPVLTVADTPGFAAHGGMVGFASEGERVRFEINLGHAERTGLKISAKLLALARVVDASPSETR